MAKGLDFNVLGNSTVIAQYSQQVEKIRTMMVEEMDFITKGQAINNVRTIDSFQGGEASCVITSHTRTKSPLGQFASDLNRINVWFSRCKNCLVVICDKKFYLEDQEAKDTLLGSFIQKANDTDKDCFVDYDDYEKRKELFDKDPSLQFDDAILLPDFIASIYKDSIGSTQSIPSSDNNDHDLNQEPVLQQQALNGNHKSDQKWILRQQDILA